MDAVSCTVHSIFPIELLSIWGRHCWRMIWDYVQMAISWPRTIAGLFSAGLFLFFRETKERHFLKPFWQLLLQITAVAATFAGVIVLFGVTTESLWCHVVCNTSSILTAIVVMHIDCCPLQLVAVNTGIVNHTHSRMGSIMSTGIVQGKSALHKHSQVDRNVPCKSPECFVPSSRSHYRPVGS